ncbi:hypothetical protein B0T20DRAFT_243688 [Sordaria brevicollis]|uniref:Uncharacterized protein n=1 Tax=Sordaria brevicollis TaxID=83679 RepID=A0AAE0PBB8_SORBR|nr:hypothetical protein B0T20DRAFT_243688 [Sordaria brevicollis]
MRLPSSPSPTHPFQRKEPSTPPSLHLSCHIVSSLAFLSPSLSVIQSVESELSGEKHSLMAAFHSEPGEPGDSFEVRSRPSSKQSLAQKLTQPGPSRHREGKKTQEGREIPANPALFAHQIPTRPQMPVSGRAWQQGRAVPGSAAVAQVQGALGPKRDATAGTGGAQRANSGGCNPET